MSEQLPTMLDRAADDHPDFRLDGDPWRRGRRIRLGRRVAGVAGALATAAAVVAGTVVLTTPELWSSPEPANDILEPTLPDTLYEVPLNIPDITDAPLGEPAAVVYSGAVRTGVFSEEARPVVVGAQSGAVRAVKDAGPLDRAVLSPDGRLLAVARALSFRGETDQPSVLVVDVVTGESTRHEFPDDGLGGGIEALAWGPDASSLAVTGLGVTSRDDGRPVSLRNFHGFLDVPTGAWHEENQAFVLAFSRDGQRSLVNGADPAGGSVVQNADDGLEAVHTALDGRFGAAFSPDSRLVAGVAGPVSRFTPSDPYELEIFDAHTGDRTVLMDLGNYADARLIGWGESGILVHTTTLGESLSSVVELIDLTDPDDPDRSTVLVDQSHSGQIGIPATYLDSDVRDASPPQAPFDWAAWVPDPLLLAIFGLIGVGVTLEYLLRRRRRRIEIVPVTGELELPPERPGR